MQLAAIDREQRSIGHGNDAMIMQWNIKLFSAARCAHPSRSPLFSSGSSVTAIGAATRRARLPSVSGLRRWGNVRLMNETADRSFSSSRAGISPEVVVLQRDRVKRIYMVRIVHRREEYVMNDHEIVPGGRRSVTNTTEGISGSRLAGRWADDQETVVPAR